MNSYTIFILHKWSKHGEEIKNLFHKHNLKWNLTKINNINISDLKEILIKFQLIDDFKVDEIITENIIASTGVWENENSSIAIKIIKIKDNDDVILIYKGIEEEFYVEFIKKCKDICPLIRKIVDNKVTFEKTTNIGLAEKLNDKDEEKKTKIKNFIVKTELNGNFSNEFKEKWIKCIKEN